MVAGAEYTIDELAREAGTTVRSVRVYHERGVLPPPQVKGRTGFYGQDHLNRVRTISRLLERGIKLNGIRELLEAWDRGEDLGVVLGVGVPAAAQPVGEAAPGQTIEATELADRYREVPNGFARIVAVGLYEPVDATTYRSADPDLARVADQLLALGIPVADMVEELEKLRIDADRVARRFADLLERTVLTDDAELEERIELAQMVPAQAMAGLVGASVRKYLSLPR
ncbi:MerR family transcriptional regulator [Nocardia sp. NPDC051832]|uniref:MerR family transcriptional regulator n=1 Tax=Nocardia sp. NPDC051832 TaxID=3155673 RepID=UPI003449514F